MDIEVILSWSLSFLIFLLVFNVLRKRKPKGAKLSVWLKLATFAMCFYATSIVVILLYWMVLDVFHLNTEGFMNLNGPFAVLIIWTVIAAGLLGLAIRYKHSLTNYYTTVKVSQIILLLPSFLIFTIFLFLISTK